MTSEHYIQYIPAPLRSRFDLLSDFQIPNLDEKRLFIQEQANNLVDKLNSIKEGTYAIDDELTEKIMRFSEENNLRHIKRLVQDTIAEDSEEDMKENEFRIFGVSQNKNHGTVIF